MQCETVRVVSPITDDNDLGYIIINKSDMTDDHTLFEEEPEPAALHIGKGPRGRLYLKIGTERVAGPYETQEEADAALAAAELAK
jgi:hypothetical protein